MDSRKGKYLTFQLEGEEYGIPIKKVKEIIGIMDITHIPKAPAFIMGVINLRGKIIPVMDLRRKFEMSYKDYNQRTCIIVIEIITSEVTRQIGIIVDTVSEVVNVQEGEVEEAPSCGSQAAEDFLLGIGKVKGKVILLLDIDKVFGSHDLVSIKEL